MGGARSIRVCLAMLAAGCGGGGGGAGEPDAGPPDASASRCELEPGELQLYTLIGVAAFEEGIDLDDDGEIDNQLGKAPVAVRDAVRDSFDRQVDVGKWVAGIYLVDLDTPGVHDDPSVGLDVVSLVDADDPRDPSNDQGGEGEFWINAWSLDLDCNSTSRTQGALVDDVFTGSSERFAFPLTTGTGTLELNDPRFEVIFDADHAHSAGKVSSYFSFCALSALPLQVEQNPSSTALEWLVNDPSLAEAAQADGDRDGDGLEVVEGDGVGILRCIDGDGTVIDGADCPCRPEIADAISNTLMWESVAATALGYR